MEKNALEMVSLEQKKLEEKINQQKETEAKLIRETAEIQQKMIVLKDEFKER